jgi:copper chaperone
VTCSNDALGKPTLVGDLRPLKRGVSGDEGLGGRFRRREEAEPVPMHTIYNVYRVDGMTCDHCAASVTEELSGLDHVTDVAVNLESGAVTIASADELSLPRVAAALASSGHRLAG